MSRAEKFIQNYTRNCSNELGAIENIEGTRVISYHEWLTPDQARRAVEIAREETIREVCEWLDDNLCCYIKAQNFSIEHGCLNDDLKKHLDNSFIKNP